jgi:hypothetical protein
MGLLAPRVVIVRRETELDRILSTHASLGSARYHIPGPTMARIEAEHAAFAAALQRMRAAIPDDWRQALIHRADIERFPFAPDDIVIAFGQDGLVANVAKYLDGQIVIGVNPAPQYNWGVLARFSVEQAGAALRPAAAGDIACEPRAMAQAELENGERLLALNEIFVGHRSHQSARYALNFAGQQERQSSSGLIVTTGTGLTGWAASILHATGQQLTLDLDRRLGFLVREAWNGPGFGDSLLLGVIDDAPLVAISEMDEGGVVFADGVESDHLHFGWGRALRIGVADKKLNLAVPA